jgi:hypothetical protein
MPKPDKAAAPTNERRATRELVERLAKALEQIATSLSQIHHELTQLPVQASNINVSLARKR